MKRSLAIALLSLAAVSLARGQTTRSAQQSTTAERLSGNIERQIMRLDSEKYEVYLRNGMGAAGKFIRL